MSFRTSTIYLNADGTLKDLKPVPIYGDSSETVAFRVVAPFNPLFAMEYFVIPATGFPTKTRPVFLQGIESKEVDGDLWNTWFFVLGQMPKETISADGTAPFKVTVRVLEVTTEDEDFQYLGQFSSLSVLNSIYPTGNTGDYAGIGNQVTRTDNQCFAWNGTIFEDQNITVGEFETNNEILVDKKIFSNTLVNFALEPSANPEGEDALPVSSLDAINQQIALLSAQQQTFVNEGGTNLEKLVNTKLTDTYIQENTIGLDATIYMETENKKPTYVTFKQFQAGVNGVNLGDPYNILQELFDEFPNDIGLLDQIGHYAGIRTTSSATGSAGTVTITADGQLVRYITTIGWQAQYEDNDNPQIGEEIFYTDSLEQIEARVTNLETFQVEVIDGTQITGEAVKATKDGSDNIITDEYSTKAERLELAGAGRTNQTVKQNADDITTQAGLTTNLRTDTDVNTAKNVSQDILINSNTNNKEDLTNKTSDINDANPESYLRTSVIKSAIDGATTEVKDDGVSLGNFNILNFSANLLVTPSGSNPDQVNIDAIGGAGGGNIATVSNKGINLPFAISDITPTKLDFGVDIITNDPDEKSLTFDINNDIEFVDGNVAGYKIAGGLAVQNTSQILTTITLEYFLDGISQGTSQAQISETSDPGETVANNFGFSKILFPTANQVLTLEVLANNTGTTVTQSVISARANYTQEGTPIEDLMFKGTYDADNSGIVDDSERLGGQLPADFSLFVDTGDKNLLNTTDKSNLVNAINEVDAVANSNEANILSESAKLQENINNTNSKVRIDDFQLSNLAGVEPLDNTFGLSIYDEDGRMVNAPVFVDSPQLPRVELRKTIEQSVEQGTEEEIIFEDSSGNNAYYEKSGNGFKELGTLGTKPFVKLRLQRQNVNSETVGVGGQLKLYKNAVFTGDVIDIPILNTEETTINYRVDPALTVAVNDVFTANLEVYAVPSIPNARIRILPDDSVYGGFKEDGNLYNFEIKAKNVEGMVGEDEEFNDNTDILPTLQPLLDGSIDVDATIITAENLLGTDGDMETFSGSSPNQVADGFTLINSSGEESSDSHTGNKAQRLFTPTNTNGRLETLPDVVPSNLNDVWYASAYFKSLNGDDARRIRLWSNNITNVLGTTDANIDGLGYTRLSVLATDNIGNGFIQLALHSNTTNIENNDTLIDSVMLINLTQDKIYINGVEVDKDDADNLFPTPFFDTQSSSYTILSETKNILDSNTWETDGIDGSGNDGANPDAFRTKLIESIYVIESQDYIFTSSNLTDIASFQKNFYDVNKNFISTSSLIDDLAFSTPANTRFIRIEAIFTGGNRPTLEDFILNYDIQVEKNTVSTSFIQYYADPNLVGGVVPIEKNELQTYEGGRIRIDIHTIGGINNYAIPTSMQGRIKSLENGVASANNDIKRNRNDVASNKEEIDLNTQGVSDNAGDIGNNATDITDLQNNKKNKGVPLLIGGIFNIPSSNTSTTASLLTQSMDDFDYLRLEINPPFAPGYIYYDIKIIDSVTDLPVKLPASKTTDLYFEIARNNATSLLLRDAEVGGTADNNIRLIEIYGINY